MLYPIKNRKDLENIRKLVSLQSQVQALGLQDNLGEQNFHKDMKKVFEPVTNSIKDVSEDLTRTMMMETSKENKKTLEKLSDKLSKILNDRCSIASNLMLPLSKITEPEHISQFKLIKDPCSKTVNYFLIKKTLPVTLYDNLLTFFDTGNEFDLQEGLSKKR